MLSLFVLSNKWENEVRQSVKRKKLRVDLSVINANQALVSWMPTVPTANIYIEAKLCTTCWYLCKDNSKENENEESTEHNKFYDVNQKF